MALVCFVETTQMDRFRIDARFGLGLGLGLGDPVSYFVRITTRRSYALTFAIASR